MSEDAPRRYEVRDVETGEKLSGVSFMLTPTGEEMHLLTDKGVSVGAMRDVGIYYSGELHDGPPENDFLPVTTILAFEYMAYKIIQQLATGRNYKALSWLGKYALRHYDKRVAEEERDGASAATTATT